MIIENVCHIEECSVLYDLICVSNIPGALWAGSPLLAPPVRLSSLPQPSRTPRKLSWEDHLHSNLTAGFPLGLANGSSQRKSGDQERANEMRSFVPPSAPSPVTEWAVSLYRKPQLGLSPSLSDSL